MKKSSLNLDSLDLDKLDISVKSLIIEYLRLERIARASDFFNFNCEYFDNKYPPSPYHREIANVLQDTTKKKIVIVAPRQSGKTTLLQRYVIWLALMKKAHFIVIIGESFQRAIDFLRDIKIEFERNERIISDFGAKKSKLWAQERIEIDNETLIMAFSKTSLRGVKYKNFRPDVVIIDDLENEASVQPKTLYFMRQWFNKTVMHIGDFDTRYIMLGTLLSRNSILADVLNDSTWHKLFYRAVMQYAKNTDLWMQWAKIVTKKNNPNALLEGRKFFEENREKMLEGAVTFWEGNPSFDYYQLMLERYVSPGLVAFESERQNNPLRSQTSLIGINEIQYYEELPKVMNFFLGVDPSLGVEDYSGFVVVGIDEHGSVYIVDSEQYFTENPLDLVKIIQKLDRAYNFTLIAIESVGFQRWLKHLLENEDPNLGKKIIQISTQYDPIIKNQKKIKIQSMRNQLLRARFNRNLTDLIEQVVSFPETERDDLLDALFLALTLVDKYTPLYIA